MSVLCSGWCGFWWGSGKVRYKWELISNTQTEIRATTSRTGSPCLSMGACSSSFGQTDRLNITRNIYSDSWFRFDCRIQSCTPIEAILNPLWGYHLTKRLSVPCHGIHETDAFKFSGERLRLWVLELHGCIIRFQSWGTRTHYGMPPEWLTVFSSPLLHGSRLTSNPYCCRWMVDRYSRLVGVDEYQNIISSSPRRKDRQRLFIW